MNCPCCGGEGVELGALGRRVHYRCRDCGIDFSEVPPATVPEKHQRKIEAQNKRMPKAMRDVLNGGK